MFRSFSRPYNATFTSFSFKSTGRRRRVGRGRGVGWINPLTIAYAMPNSRGLRLWARRSVTAAPSRSLQIKICGFMLGPALNQQRRCRTRRRIHEKYQIGSHDRGGAAEVFWDCSRKALGRQRLQLLLDRRTQTKKCDQKRHAAINVERT